MDAFSDAFLYHEPLEPHNKKTRPGQKMPGMFDQK